MRSQNIISRYRGKTDSNLGFGSPKGRIFVINTGKLPVASILSVFINVVPMILPNITVSGCDP